MRRYSIPVVALGLAVALAIPTLTPAQEGGAKTKARPAAPEFSDPLGAMPNEPMLAPRFAQLDGDGPPPPRPPRPDRPDRPNRPERPDRPPRPDFPGHPGFGPAGPWGPGGLGGPGGPEGPDGHHLERLLHNPIVAAALDLTEEQIEEIKADAEARREATEPIREQVKDLRKQLFELLTGGQDPAGQMVQQLVEEIGLLETSIKVEMSLHAVKVREVLTSEQEARLRRIVKAMRKHGRRGPGHAGPGLIPPPPPPGEIDE